MEPSQTSTDSEHLPALQFLFGRIIAFGWRVDACLPFPITSLPIKKVTPNCLVLYISLNGFDLYCHANWYIYIDKKYY